HAFSLPAKACYASMAVDPAYAVSRAVTGATVAPYAGSSGYLITLAIGSHNFAVGDSMAISGMSPAYNGSFLIYSVTSTTVTYQLLSSPGTYTGGGTVTSPNVRLFNANACYGGLSSGQQAPAAPTNLQVMD